MSDCLFCKILNKEIPNFTIYEDDFVLAFLDIFPHAKGHTVVIPKQHFNTPFEMDEKYWLNFCVGLKKAQEKVEQILAPSGYNVGWNQKPVGGQVVPHLHVHIIPRWGNDNGGSIHSVVDNPPKESLEEVKDKIINT